MTTTLMNPPAQKRAEQTLASILAGAHDRWMADSDAVLGPVTDPNATFLQRWAAVRYVADGFLERFHLEQQLLEELHPFIMPELRERLRMQVGRLARLHQDLVRLAPQRGTAREVARTAREFLEALRLWYAEIELAVGALRQQEIGRPRIAC